MEQPACPPRPAQWELGAPRLQTARSGMASAAEHFIHYEETNNKVRSMSLDGAESLRSHDPLAVAGSLQHVLFDAQASVSRLPSAHSAPKAFLHPGFNSSKLQQPSMAPGVLAQQQHAVPGAGPHTLHSALADDRQQQLLQQSMQQTYQSIMAAQAPRHSISDALSAHSEPYTLPGQPSLPPVRTMTGRTLERLFEEAESAFGLPLGEATSMPLLDGADDAAMGPILRYNSNDVLREFGSVLRANSLQVLSDGSPLAAYSHAHSSSGAGGSPLAAFSNAHTLSGGGDGGSNGGSASTPVSGDGSMLCSFPPPSMPLIGHGRVRQQSPFGIEARHQASGTTLQQHQRQQQQHGQVPSAPALNSYRRPGGKQVPGSPMQPPTTASPPSFTAGAPGVSPGVSEPQNRGRSARTSLPNPGGVSSPTARQYAAPRARHSAPSGQLRRKLGADSASDDSSSFSAGDSGAWKLGAAGDAEAEGPVARGSPAKRPRTSTPSGKAKSKGVRKAERFADNKGGRIHCYNCGTHQTPQWRCGPEGPRTLCNACGVRFKKGLPMPYLVKKQREAAAATAAAAAAVAPATAGVDDALAVANAAAAGLAAAGSTRAVATGAIAMAASSGGGHTNNAAGGAVMGHSAGGFIQAAQPMQLLQPGGAAFQHSMYGRAGQFAAPAWL